MQSNFPLIMDENGKRYRLLMAGETLEDGDQVTYSDKWNEVGPGAFGKSIGSNTYGAYPYGYYRRQIPKV